MADPVARFDNSLFRGEQVTATPGTTYRTAAEAEAAARRIAAGNQDAVVVVVGDGYRVDVMDELSARQPGRFGSNELYGAERNVAAFVTGRGDTVSLRGANDGSAMVDRLAQVFQRAGFNETEARAFASRGLTSAQARELHGRLLATNPGLGDFGPRVMAMRVLERAALQGNGMTGLELTGEFQRHSRLAVVRPDGYMANLESGDPYYRVGEPRLQDGRLVAGQEDVGALYQNNSQVFRRVDADLRPVGPMMEMGIQQALGGDFERGAVRAVAGLVSGVSDFVHDPVRSLEGLSRLPENIASTIRNSPELWERFKNMNGADQWQTIGNLSANAYMLATGVGAIRGATMRAGSALGEVNLAPLFPPMGPTPALAVAGRSVVRAGAQVGARVDGAALLNPVGGAAAAVYGASVVNDGLTTLRVIDGPTTPRSATPTTPTNWRSRPQFGHTFETHGQGQNVTRNLVGRANGPRGGQQGQWLNNERAAEFLRTLNLEGVKVGEAIRVEIPRGLGQVIMPDGGIVEATHALVSPSASGIRTAFPVLLRH